jgi:hypothetical protein
MVKIPGCTYRCSNFRIVKVEELPSVIVASSTQLANRLLKVHDTYSSVTSSLRVLFGALATVTQQLNLHMSKYCT